MDDMQTRYLIILLAQYEEDCVEKFRKFAKIVPPTNLGHHHFIGIICIANRLASVAVAKQPAVCQRLKLC